MLPNFKSLKFKQLILSVITLLIISTIPETSSKKDEAMRLRSLLEYIPRFKGRAYSNKLNINYENNKFSCKAAGNITPKEFSFLSSSGYSICSDKIYENFELLAQKINAEVDTQLEPKSITNVNFLNDFKQVLFFAYNLAYSVDAEEHKLNKTVSSEFYDKVKFSYTQSEILDNLPNYSFNLLEFAVEDYRILNQYVHTVMDFNINAVKGRVNAIVDNIEKGLRANPVYKRWLVGNSAHIKYLVGLIWANAMNLDFETLKNFSFDLKSKLDDTENQSKIQNIRNILTYSEKPGVLCIFEFLNLCGLPKKIGSSEEESAYVIKKDVADKRIIFYNNKNFEANQNYFYIKNKQWTNLDYLLSQGEIIEDFYNDYHRIYINMRDAEAQKNLESRKEHIQNFITKEVFAKFQQILQCKSCHQVLTLKLKNSDFENLRKFFEIVYPNNQNKSNLAMLFTLHENLYKNLQIKIDFENKMRFKDYNTDLAILNLVAGLKQEMRNLKGDKVDLLNTYNNRLKVIQFVRNSRNVLWNFSTGLFEESKKGLFNDIKNIKKNYV